MKQPTTFGRYLLLERIGVGGMAEVFLAKVFGAEGFEQFLAIKRVVPTMAEEQMFITMLIDEAKISVQLNHANIVQTQEFGIYEGTYYIAMGYIAGQNLHTILRRYLRHKEFMPTAQSVYIVSKMCEGLDYAHRKKDSQGRDLNIVHRGLSLTDTLVSYDGDVKVIDFGIAKSAGRLTQTQPGIIKGKLRYMSPEQIRGLELDHRSDIFAVGAILYELLTGNMLFAGESDLAVASQVIEAKVPPVRHFNPKIPATLEKVVLRALARRPEDRYQWASELQEDLMKFLPEGKALYSGKHLSAYMKAAFAEEMLLEAVKMERYAKLKRTDAFEISIMGSMPSQSGRPVQVLAGNGYPAAPETLAMVASHPSHIRASDAVDVAILTVIPSELFAALAALGVSETDRERSPHGTVYFRGSLRSHLARQYYQLVVTCIGAAGNYDASAAAAEVIATYRPRLLLLMGIAAGIRGKVRIGEAIISERIVAYEPTAIVASEDERSAHMEHRPEIDRLHHVVNQDVVTYRHEPARLEAAFLRAGGRYPIPPIGKEEEFLGNVASAIAGRIATIASGEKLLRDPAKLRAVRREQHGKVEVGEMEAAGLVAACRRANIPWLVIRGISDFGDAFKDDQFHDFASRAAAAVLADFLAHGLDLRPLGSGTIPHYLDSEIRRLSIELDDARERKRRLQSACASTAQVDQEIISLRRRLREGGQLRAGDSLGDGRFLLIESIGQGGFAHIWRAIDRAQGEPQTVAIKVLHANLAGDAQRRERFFRGARIMTELEHPAVVRVIEQHGHDAGYYYFVMEFIPGGNFREAVLKKALTLDQVISIILRTSEALAFAHARNFVHRDIKPANILLDGQGQARLTDFDLVSALDTTGGTRSGAMGTFAYAAPECLHHPQEADQRADVYGLGMTAIFGLHGADLPVHLVYRAPESILAQLPCPQALKVVLSKAISVEPSSRYRNASEFLAAIEQSYPEGGS